MWISEDSCVYYFIRKYIEMIVDLSFIRNMYLKPYIIPKKIGKKE